MRLEVGKSYESRSGEIVRIVELKANSNTYPYIGDNDISYMENGRYYKGNQDSRDLIEEVISITVTIPDSTPTLKELMDKVINLTYILELAKKELKDRL